MGWFMHYCVHGSTMRHLYATILGLLIQLYMYGEGIKHSFVLSIVVYAMMCLLPRKKQAMYVMFFCLAYLSGQHIYRMFENFGGFDLDITTFTMLLICKLSALAYCYEDGGKLQDKLTEEQKTWRVENIPNLLEYFSYVFFC